MYSLHKLIDDPEARLTETIDTEIGLQNRRRSGNKKWVYFMPVFFVLGVIAAIILIANLSVAESVRYNSLQGDAVRVKSVHDRIVFNPKPIDIAFVGSSHTWNGVDDAAVENALKKQGLDVSVANLASSWPGRDLRVLQLKQLLQYKHPHLVVIEVMEHETPYGHGILPYVANAEDMFCCRFYLDVRWPQHFALFLKRQILNHSELFGYREQTQYTPDLQPFGWMPRDGKWKNPTPLTALHGMKARLKEAGYIATQWFGISAVQKMVELAHSDGVEVRFLYMPEFAYARGEPVIPVEKYTRMAPMFNMPTSITQNPALWHDKAHLNREGAAILAPSLIHQLYEAVKATPKLNKLFR